MKNNKSLSGLKDAGGQQKTEEYVIDPEKILKYTRGNRVKTKVRNGHDATYFISLWFHLFSLTILALLFPPIPDNLIFHFPHISVPSEPLAAFRQCRGVKCVSRALPDFDPHVVCFPTLPNMTSSQN